MGMSLRVIGCLIKGGQLLGQGSTALTLTSGCQKNLPLVAGVGQEDILGPADLAPTHNSINKFGLTMI